MQFVINIEKKQLYGFLFGLIVILSAFLVAAFGGNTPSVMGHSGGEIEVAGLAGTAAGLNIGGNAATATTATTAGSASTASTASLCGTGSDACRFNGGSGTGGDGSCGGNPPRLGSDSCYINVYGANGFCVPGGSCTTTATVINPTGDVRVKSGNAGGTQLVRCTVAGALPIGAITFNSGNCGASTGIGIFVT